LSLKDNSSRAATFHLDRLGITIFKSAERIDQHISAELLVLFIFPFFS